jgi:hypothetical protein
MQLLADGAEGGAGEMAVDDLLAKIDGDGAGHGRDSCEG